ncbi:MAG: methyltransferase domain-containing protein [Candidatus Thorarchaeota archaeon]|nr:methyltransferase domain-containing protein [Candidatus Thorarchaeota archaeon]
MKTPELKAAILRLAGKREFYGYEMHKELEEKKIKIGIGRLYSILSEMNEESLLKDRWEKSQSGPERRIYRIDKKGEIAREKILKEAIRTVHEFYIEYLRDLPPESSAFKIVSGILTRGIPKNANVAYVATMFSGPLRSIITQMREDISGGRIYAISESTKSTELRLEDVSTIEGVFDDIPMKDEYLDLLVISGNIDSECLERCLSEWKRVLSKNGTLAIVTPTATITTYKDPLGIGEFVEQREHPRINGEGMLDSETLLAEMRRHFESVDEQKVVHISVLLGTKHV